MHSDFFSRKVDHALLIHAYKIKLFLMDQNLPYQQ